MTLSTHVTSKVISVVSATDLLSTEDGTSWIHLKCYMNVHHNLLGVLQWMGGWVDG